jgi:hypothetical protein
MATISPHHNTLVFFVKAIELLSIYYTEIEGVIDRTNSFSSAVFALSFVFKNSAARCVCGVSPQV